MRFCTVVLIVTTALSGLQPGIAQLTAAPTSNEDDAHPGDVSRTAPVVVFSQDRIVEAINWSLTADGGIVCSTATGGSAPVQIPSPGFLDADRLADRSLTSASVASRPARESAAFACIKLANNEILRGAIQDSDSPDVLTVDVARLGLQRLSTKDVVAISFAGRATAAQSAERSGKPPYLLLANGDLLAGAIRAIGAGGATVASDFGETRVEWSRVSAAILGGAPAIVDGRRPGDFLCVLADGQRWHADALATGPTPQEARLRRGQSLANIPVSIIRQLVFPGWTFQRLTCLGTPKVETTPYLDEIVQVAWDDAAHQHQRSIAGRWFDTGLTTRPRSRVTYVLPSTANYLSGWVGLDALRGRFGNCDARVEVAGQPAAVFKGLTARQSARRIAVPVRGGGPIGLMTDFGPNGEIGDYVNWCDLMVIAKQADR